jgi:hypothetical protein
MKSSAPGDSSGSGTFFTPVFKALHPFIKSAEKLTEIHSCAHFEYEWFDSLSTREGLSLPLFFAPPEKPKVRGCNIG